MKRWVVTGPAGAGKSLLCSLLGAKGAAILDGDRLGHEILGRTETVDRIEAAFGPGVIAAGQVDRTALGEIVFRDQGALERLNRIMHGSLTGLVSRRLDELAATGRYRLAVLDAAVYFLLPPVPGIDLVVTVTADEDIRIKRLTERGDRSPDRVRALVASQRPLEEAWLGADLVLTNDGSATEWEQAAEQLWNRLCD